jgi:hypothetical protein
MQGMANLRPYSRAEALSKIDGRTREGKLMQETRAELVRHLGGAPTVAQRALIERAVWMTLHLAVMDRRTAEKGGQMTEHDSVRYLAWTNTLTRTIRAIGLRGEGNPQRPSLSDHLAARATAP